MNNQPPKLARKFLEWYCPASLHEGIEGDLVEQFEEDVARIGMRKARIRFVLNVLRFFRPSILLRNKFAHSLFKTTMFKNYLTIAFRSLWRAKTHSLINILGLGLGITCCILISLFVRDELTFDRFHSKADRIYRVYAKENWGEGQQFFNTVTPFPMGPALKDNLPEVESQVQILSTNAQVKVGEKQFNESVTVAGKDFFHVFDFHAIQGTKETVLEEQNNVVLTQRMAQKYFGDADAINKMISIQVQDKFEVFTVKAVTENPPTNSSIQYDILISNLNNARFFGERILTSWFNIFPETYVLLQKGVESKSVEQKFPPIFRTALGEEDFKNSKYTAGLQPLTDIHLNVDFPVGAAPVSNPKYSYILAAIAVLILLVACINFVTLSIGRSLKRAKEVGIRKVVGALRTQLISQFVGEAILVTLLATVIGVMLAVVNLPVFNDLSGKQLLFSIDSFIVIVVASLLLIIGLISGSYPAFILSSFQPASILKGMAVGNSRQHLRKVLVGVQLILSIFLVSSTLLMRQQLDFIQKKDMGFDRDQVVVIQLVVPLGGRLAERVKTGFEKAEQFKIELAKFPEIASACGSSHDFGNGGWMAIGYTDEGKTYRTFYMNTVDDEYIPTLKMKMAAGRNFSDASSADARRGVIVNEAFVKEYGWTDAIGKKIPGKNFEDHEIIGVVKDFNFTSLYTKVPPLAMVQDPSILLKGSENINVDNSPFPKLIVRLKAGAVSAGIERLKETWQKIAGEEEFSFAFVDQSIAKQYKSDQNLGKIVTIAAVIAVLIASLGLYALASLAMQNRTKEISIRKVMGATENSLLVLLTKEYIVLTLVCLVVSVPVTWYLMQQWLASFEYRIYIGAGIFIMAGAISLFIALATISFQTLKTVWTNPVKSLKYE
jgi:putative ABC transport system permease protein